MQGTGIDAMVDGRELGSVEGRISERGPASNTMGWVQIGSAGHDDSHTSYCSSGGVCVGLESLWCSSSGKAEVA